MTIVLIRKGDVTPRDKAGDKKGYYPQINLPPMGQRSPGKSRPDYLRRDVTGTVTNWATLGADGGTTRTAKCGYNNGKRVRSRGAGPTFVVVKRTAKKIFDKS